MFPDFFKRNPLLTFLLLALVVRAFTLLPVIIDHDEATYLVIANEWLKGHIPFTTYVDIKPIGIYALFAAVIALFGQSLIAIRFFTIIIIGLTAFFLFKAKREAGGSLSVAFLTGGFYCILLSIDHWGWASNTELFFNFFTSVALLFILKQPSFHHAFLVGLIMGLGFKIKYHVLFDAMAFGLIYLSNNKVSFNFRLVSIMLMILGGSLPLAFTNLFYYLSGNYNDFIYASFVIPSRYQLSTTLLEKSTYVSVFYLSFLPLLVTTVMGSYQLYKHKLMTTEQWVIRLIWPILVWFAILLTGQTFKHYYIQAILPLCFCAFDYISFIKQRQKKYQIWSYTLQSLAIALVLVSVIHQYFSIYESKKLQNKVVEEIQKDFSPSSKIYSERMVLHFLLDSSPVQRFIHPSLYDTPSHIEAFGINVEKTFEEINAAQVKYIYCSEKRALFFGEAISKYYSKIGLYPKTFSLWKRKQVVKK